MKGLDYLTEAYNVVEKHRNESPERQVEIMREYMKKFFYENIVCGTSKFDMYKFAANDKIRPQMNGVLHDKGFKVASDGHVLAVIPDVYPDEYEGKILAKDGTELEGRYPNYRACIPDYTEETDSVFTVDIKRLKEAIRKAKAERKLNGKDTFINVKIEGVHFRDEIAQKILMFLNAFPKAKMFVKGKDMEARISHAMLLKLGDTIGLFIPCCPPNEDSETVVVNY